MTSNSLGSNFNFVEKVKSRSSFFRENLFRVAKRGKLKKCALIKSLFRGESFFNL